MYDIVMHVGTEHPNLLWVAVPSILSFAAGLGIGLFARRDTTSETPDNLADTANEE